MVYGHCIFDMTIIRCQHFRSGRPATAVTPENRNWIYALIKHDYHIETQGLCQAMSTGKLSAISITQELG
jgi:hypothetical protein